MKCDEDNCSQEARFYIIVNLKMVPLCECCMIESMCAEPTAVISIEAYEEHILKVSAVLDIKKAS